MTLHPPGSGEPSPETSDIAHWLNQLGQMLALARVHGPTAPVVRQNREHLAAEGLALVARHGVVALCCSPGALTRAGDPTPLELPSGGAELASFLYRNGLSRWTLLDTVQRRNLTAFLQTLLDVQHHGGPDDDLATRLWAHPLEGIPVDPVPVPAAEDRPSPPGVVALPLGVPAWIDSHLREAQPPPVLERLSVERLSAPASGTSDPTTAGDDWLLPASESDAGAMWRQLQLDEDREREQFISVFERERSRPWAQRVHEFVDEVRATDKTPETREALLASLVTWVAAAAERCDWPEALEALGSLRRLDPDGSLTDEALSGALSALDAEAVRERLDESSSEVQARFFEFAVALRTPALDLLIKVMGSSGRSRLRAAATTALTYTCGDAPQLLTRHLKDSRWHVVRNIVFILGQIGGPAVTPLLAIAAKHVDARVRRAVVQALGQVPALQRNALLLQNLDTHDRSLLAATLHLLAREPDARVAQALVARILAPDFESLPEDRRLALLETLGDVADDEAVPALEQLLQRGGWFARRTAERDAAAQTLARIGTPLALAVLHAGMNARSESVRAACQQALASGGRTA